MNLFLVKNNEFIISAKLTVWWVCDCCSCFDTLEGLTLVEFVCNSFFTHIFGACLVVQVERKSHPHPERPDRLQAIAASLAAAGISVLMFFVFLKLILKAFDLSFINSLALIAKLK